MIQFLRKTMMWLCAAAVIVSLASCKKEETGKSGKAPVVTEDMFTVRADADDPKLIHFDFNASGMQPSWNIERPGGENHKTNEAHFSLIYSKAGTYNGTVTAYNSNGMSEPFPFTFDVEPGEAGNSEMERMLMAHKWKVANLGNLRDGKETMYNGVNEVTIDDEIAFNRDYSLTISRGDTPLVYNDRVKSENWVEYPVTGKESWVLIEDGGKAVLEFSNGGFPLVLKDENGIDGTYEVEKLEENYLRLVWKDWKYDFSYFVIILTEEGYIAPDPDPDPEPDPVEIKDHEKDALLMAYSWKFKEIGNNVDGAVRLTSRNTDDVIYFSENHLFVLDPGANQTLYIATDPGSLEYKFPSLTGLEHWKWMISEADGKLWLDLFNGAFPGAYANQDAMKGGRYELTIVSDTEIRLDIKQDDEKIFYMIFTANEKIGTEPEPEPDPELEAFKIVLTANPWKPTAGYEGSYLSSRTKDDVLTFHPDGRFILDRGTNTGIYVDDGGSLGVTEASGNERWEAVSLDGQIYVRFSGGGLGFPGATGDASGNNADWAVPEYSAGRLVLSYKKQSSDGSYALVFSPAE